MFLVRSSLQPRPAIPTVGRYKGCASGRCDRICNPAYPASCMDELYWRDQRCLERHRSRRQPDRGRGLYVQALYTKYNNQCLDKCALARRARAGLTHVDGHGSQTQTKDQGTSPWSWDLRHVSPQITGVFVRYQTIIGLSTIDNQEHINGTRESYCECSTTYSPSRALSLTSINTMQRHHTKQYI